MRPPSWKKRQELSPEQAGARPGLKNRMDRFFETFFGEPWKESGLPATAGGWMPDVDVKERGDSIEVRAEIPGMDPKDIEINVRGTALTISGEKKQEREEKKEGLYYSEISYGTFFRAVELPEMADPDRVSARYDQGVLTIIVGKKEGAAPKRVEVTSAETKTGAPPPAK